MSAIAKQKKQRKMQTVPVYSAESFRVVNGANLGDPISISDDLCLDDTFSLRAAAPRQKLSLILNDDGLRVGKNGDTGQFMNRLFLDCTVTLMNQKGHVIEALIVVEVDDADIIQSTLLMPLCPIEAKVEYTLIDVNRDTAEAKFAQIACVSFVKGTRITLATGQMIPIEDLRAGDCVITRDAGIQEIRWVGHSTVRATGDFSPVIIKAKALHNQNDLIVSPEHRLFIYQRSDQLGTGRAETLIRASQLVDGESVTRLEAGFVDYYQLLFDDHHIIYAEGIAAESLLFDHRTRSALPDQATNGIDAHRTRYNDDLEVNAETFKGSSPVSILRLASTS